MSLNDTDIAFAFAPSFNPKSFAKPSPAFISPVDTSNDDDEKLPTMTPEDTFSNHINFSDSHFYDDNVDYPFRCGVPGICKSTAEQNCFNVTLANCSDCSSVASGFFVFIILCLGLALLCGNSLILAVSVQLHKKRKATKLDWFRASLAIADLLTGFQIFLVTFPSFGWTMNSTLQQIDSHVNIFRNSGQAIAGGFFYLLIYTSSIYHLLLMGVMRLYTILWPFRYRRLTNKSLYIGIGSVWILAAVVASFPAWFPQHLQFEYYYVTFLYLPALQYTPNFSFTPGIIILVLWLIIPYILMTMISISTAVLIRKQVKSSKQRLGKNTGSSSHETFSKEEIAAFKTVLVMQIGFTITLVPSFVSAGLLYSGYLTCDSFSTIYMVCIYIGMTNSLVNVFVYSVREKKFRSNARDVFRNVKLFFDWTPFSNTNSSIFSSKIKTVDLTQSSTV